MSSAERYFESSLSISCTSQIGQLVMFQLVSATDAATNSVHYCLCSAFSLGYHTVAFPCFDTSAFLSSIQSVRLLAGLPFDLYGFYVMFFNPVIFHA